MSKNNPEARPPRPSQGVSLFGTGSGLAHGDMDVVGASARAALVASDSLPMFAPARVWKSLTDAALSDAKLIENGLFPHSNSEPAVTAFDLLRTRGTRTRKQLAQMTGDLLQSPRWRPARWALVAIVLANLAGLQVWAWKEQAALAAKRTGLREILTITFPDVRVVVEHDDLGHVIAIGLRSHAHGIERFLMPYSGQRRIVVAPINEAEDVTKDPELPDTNEA